MARKKRRTVDEVRRHPRWGATKAQGRRYQETRDLKNRIHELETELASAAERIDAHQTRVKALSSEVYGPIPMLLWCPECGERHIDEAFANKPHHTHACQHCGMVWRPAVRHTVGVRFLPGFSDAGLATGKVPT